MQATFWFGVLGFVAYLLWRSRRKNPPVAAIVPDPVAEEVPPVLTPEETEISRARKLNEAGSEARSIAYQKHKESLRQAEEKLSQANKFMRESGLDIAVPWLYDEMQHWPSWLSNSPGWELPLKISEVEGGGTYGDRWIAWRTGSKRFKLRFEKQKNYGMNDGTDHAKFFLDSDGEQVLEIICSQACTNEFDNWSYFAVDVLKVGDWVPDFISYYQEARLAHEMKTYERDSKYTLGRAGGIDLEL